MSCRKGLQSRCEMLPDVRDEDLPHFATGSMGVSERLVTGAQKSGEEVKARGCNHYEFRGGKIVRKDSYWKMVG